MGILQPPSVLPGQVGVIGAAKYMVSTDSIATITTAGYLNNLDLAVFPIAASDIIGLTYNYNVQTGAGNFTWATIALSNGTITIVEAVNPGNVLLPVVSGDIAIFNGTTGQLKDSNQKATNLASPFQVTSPGSVVIGDLLSAADVNGTIADTGIAATSVAISSLASPDASSNLIWHDVTCTAAALATAGKVNIQVSSGSKQYVVRNVLVNYSAAGLSGGGGNRLLAISDGTNVFNNAGITAALLGTPINTVWGGTGNPLPGTLAMDTASVAGATIFAQYTGGTTDYTTGSVVISILVQRTA
jgi:hypothetical protein